METKMTCDATVSYEVGDKVIYNGLECVITKVTNV